MDKHRETPYKPTIILNVLSVQKELNYDFHRGPGEEAVNAVKKIAFGNTFSVIATVTSFFILGLVCVCLIKIAHCICRTERREIIDDVEDVNANAVKMTAVNFPPSPASSKKANVHSAHEAHAPPYREDDNYDEDSAVVERLAALPDAATTDPSEDEAS